MNFLFNLKNRKKIFFVKENSYYLIMILAIFFFDRYSKLNILDNFNDDTYYINKFLNFELIWNSGIGFGLLSFNSGLIYNLISSVIGIVIFLLILIGLNSTKIDKISISVIIGGAIGNFYDRLVYKAVPDFIDLHYNNFHWFTFNVADIFITVGILTFIIGDIIFKEKK